MSVIENNPSVKTSKGTFYVVQSPGVSVFNDLGQFVVNLPVFFDPANEVTVQELIDAIEQSEAV